MNVDSPVKWDLYLHNLIVHQYATFHGVRRDHVESQIHLDKVRISLSTENLKLEKFVSISFVIIVQINNCSAYR